MQYRYKVSVIIGRLKTKIGLAAACLALAAGGLSFSSVAFAAGSTLYVGHGSVGHNTSCASPGYNSVQSAVNAASNGQTVYLCGGQFSQQVFVNKSITLTGQNGSGLTATGTTFSTSTTSYPSQFTTDGLFVPQALLVLTGNAVSVSNLTISGPMTNGGCANEEYGVLALAGHDNLSNDQVLNIADTNTGLYGCQFGVGVEIGSQQWPTADFSNWPYPNFAATANINNVTVAGYQKNGITVDGPGSSANITGSTVTGGGSGAPFGTVVAQNGIQISDGATGNVSNNRISNNAYTGTGWASSTGILVWGGDGFPLSNGVTVTNNTLVNNDVGISLDNYSSDGTGSATTATKEAVYGNHVSNKAVTNVSGLCDGSSSCGGKLIGYQAGISDVGNGDTIFGNVISGKGYASQGKYDFAATPPVFTQTGPNAAFVRPIDAGGSFPTINAKVYGNNYGSTPFNTFFNFFNGYSIRFHHARHFGFY